MVAFLAFSVDKVAFSSAKKENHSDCCLLLKGKAKSNNPTNFGTLGWQIGTILQSIFTISFTILRPRP